MHLIWEVIVKSGSTPDLLRRNSRVVKVGGRWALASTYVLRLCQSSLARFMEQRIGVVGVGSGKGRGKAGDYD